MLLERLVNIDTKNSWPIVFKIKSRCNQWEGVSCIQVPPIIFLLSWGGVLEEFFIFPFAPNVFPSGSQWTPILSSPSFQHVPQHILSSTSLPSHMFWQNVVLLSPILEWPVPMAQVWTNCKIKKLNMQHCFAKYIYKIWRVKYERKSYLNWMVDSEVWPCFQLIFPSKFTWLLIIYLNFEIKKITQIFNISHILSPELMK
jgi:hypothetical protein